jgi:hypothetical protein
MGSWRNQGYNRARDANERTIICGLESAGLMVFRIDEPGDLAVYSVATYEWFILEVKNPATHTRGKGGEVRTEQQRALDPEVQAGIGIVTSVDEAFDWIYTRVRKRHNRHHSDRYGGSP